ncbi:MAG: hypothetical protein ACK559_05015, partial [bacterium]
LQVAHLHVVDRGLDHRAGAQVARDEAQADRVGGRRDEVLHAELLVDPRTRVLGHEFELHPGRAAVARDLDRHRVVVRVGALVVAVPARIGDVGIAQSSHG